MVEWPMVSFVAAMAGGYPSARIAITQDTNSSSCMRSLLGFNDAEIDALLLLHRNPPVGAHRPERIVGDFPNVPVGDRKNNRSNRPRRSCAAARSEAHTS